MPCNSGTVGIRQPPPATVRPSTQALASYQLLSALGPTYQSRPVALSVIAVLALCGHLIADLVYMYLDPRIRYQ